MTRREEVAKKLRKIWSENGGFFLTSDNAVYEIGKAIGAQGKPYDFFFNRLADLIDPTCHLLRVNDGDGIKYTCSNCVHFDGNGVVELSEQGMNTLKYRIYADIGRSRNE